MVDFLIQGENTPPAGCARQPVGGLQTHYGPWNQEMGGFWANAAGALAKRSACAGKGICGPNTGSATCKSAGMAVAAHIWHRAQFSQPSCDAMVADGLAWCVDAASAGVAVCPSMALVAMSSQWWPLACAAAGVPWCAVVAMLAVSAAAMRVAISSLAMPRRGARAINRMRRTTRMVWMIRRRPPKFHRWLSGVSNQPVALVNIAQAAMKTGAIKRRSASAPKRQSPRSPGP